MVKMARAQYFAYVAWFHKNGALILHLLQNRNISRSISFRKTTCGNNFKICFYKETWEEKTEYLV